MVYPRDLAGNAEEEETLSHIPWPCPHLETIHQQFQSKDTKVDTKLWGQAAEVQQTVAANGLMM